MIVLCIKNYTKQNDAYSWCLYKKDSAVNHANREFRNQVS